ncbi:MAG: D-Ala-D-Ala carboxypeptidase family metallohydrolase [Bacteroidaceae bacterium]|nr:D-Ala-D-Ala carboxypeptidase family metallohydrolase [Bacteroidaceae bacterium]
MQLTKNFKLEEFAKSETAQKRGIDNSIPAALIPNITALCENVLQPLRDAVGVPVKISSGYRCPALNKAVGGSANSQHMKGEAADIVIPDKKTGLKWFEWMRTHLTYNQLIWETNSRGGSWIHVGYKRTGKNKMQVLNMKVV